MRVFICGMCASGGIDSCQAQVPAPFAGSTRPRRARPKFRSRRRDSANLPLAAKGSVGHIGGSRRRGRVAEGGGLLNRYRVVKPYRGFESLRLRHQSIARPNRLAKLHRPLNPGGSPRPTAPRLLRRSPVSTADSLVQRSAHNCSTCHIHVRGSHYRCMRTPAPGRKVRSSRSRSRSHSREPRHRPTRRPILRGPLPRPTRRRDQVRLCHATLPRDAAKRCRREQEHPPQSTQSLSSSSGKPSSPRDC